MGQWKVFPEGKLAPVGPPPTAETGVQTIHLLDGQLTVYTDDSATSGAKDGGAGAIVTFGDPADPTILEKQQPCNSHWNGPPPTTPSTKLQSASTVNGRHQSMAEMQAKSALLRRSHDLPCQFIAAMGASVRKLTATPINVL